MIVYSAIVKCTFILFLQSLQCVRTDQSAAPNTTEDATVLFNLLTIMGFPDKEHIVGLLANRTNAQRQEIKAAYKSMYNLDINSAIEDRLGSDLRETVLSLLIPQREFYARKLNQAMEGIGTDETALNDILPAMNRSEVLDVAATYEKLFKKTLMDDLIAETSASYEDLVVALGNGSRPDDTEVDQNSTISDVYQIKYALQNPLPHLMEKSLITIFTTRSFAQLKMIFKEFKQIMKKDISTIIGDAIKNIDLYNGLINIVKIVHNKTEFYAESLYDSMAGYGTDDSQLIRIIVGRSEIDLPEIRDAYYQMYNAPLVESIVNDTSGLYTFLLCLLVQKN